MVIFSRFQPQNIDSQKLRYIQRVLSKNLIGIFISRESGSLLYSWQIDPTFRINLVSQFIAALSIFGEENLGHIKRIFIEGLETEIQVVAKHGLICTTVFKADMVKDHLDLEGIRILDQFVAKYSSQLEKNRCNQAIYRSFDPIFWELMYEYLQRVGTFNEYIPSLEFGEGMTASSAKSDSLD
ncbi:MAG: hypothetical protein ACTSVZ_13740 [Promethearchaeota archaeon]